MSSSTSKGGEGSPAKPYVVVVSVRFILATLSLSFFLAFTVGTAARIMLIEGPLRALKSSHDESPMRVRPDYHDHARSLPQPILQEGKEMPQTLYTSKNFDTAMSTASSSLLMEDAKKKSKEFVNDDKDWIAGSCGAEEGQCTRGKGHLHEEPKEEPGAEEDEEEHLPAGQHLLVDIKDVDAAFLNSEERLAQAMIDICNISKLTLLSYHCHKLYPSGISCAGVLLESHVAFHTWPEEGVITLDLFTCGSAPLLPVVPIIIDMFGIPHADGHGDQPIALWAHKQRGFRDLQKRLGHLDSYDLGRGVLGVMDFDMKKEVRYSPNKIFFHFFCFFSSILPRTNIRLLLCKHHSNVLTFTTYSSPWKLIWKHMNAVCLMTALMNQKIQISSNQTV